VRKQASIERLHREMQKATNVMKGWEFKTFHRRYYDQTKNERQEKARGTVT
jgi:hypothetical protein